MQTILVSDSSGPVCINEEYSIRLMSKLKVNITRSMDRKNSICWNIMLCSPLKIIG
jgi:hypothetical protein